MEIKHNDFTRLFQRYGWTVEQLDDNSFVAYNGTYFVPFSIDHKGCASAVSYLLCDKEKFVQEWKNSKYLSPIGYYAFNMWMNGYKKFIHYGGICNHDHSTYEIESWLHRCEEMR